MVKQPYLFCKDLSGPAVHTHCVGTGHSSDPPRAHGAWLPQGEKAASACQGIDSTRMRTRLQRQHSERQAGRRQVVMVHVGGSGSARRLRPRLQRPRRAAGPRGRRGAPRCDTQSLAEAFRCSGAGKSGEWLQERRRRGALETVVVPDHGRFSCEYSGLGGWLSEEKGLS